MLLRTRLALVVLSGFLLVGAIVAAALFSAGQLIISQVDDLVEKNAYALWQSNLIAETGALDAFARQLASDAGINESLAAGDLDHVRTALSDVVSRRDATSKPDIVELETVDGQSAFRSPPDAASQPLIDQVAISDLGRLKHLGGLRAASSGMFYVITSIPVESSGKVVGALTVARSVDRVVDVFAQANNSQAALVALRGQLVYTTKPSVWQSVRDEITLRQTSRKLVIADANVISVWSLPIRDASNALTGTLVAFRDFTAQYQQLRSAVLWSGGLIAGLVLLSGLSVYAYLAAAFRPLNQAIDVARALASGDTTQELDTIGADEIGQIGEALRQLRLRALEALEASRQRERTRRRRERLIRREVTVLAEALEPQARNEILAVLHSNPPPASTEISTFGNSSSNYQLRLIANVLRDLVRRILEQRHAMTGMISQLEESLATKDKLAALQQQLSIARDVQSSILPRDYNTDRRLSVFGQMTPASEVGGDFFDCFMINDDVMVVLVADVSGKGIGAALFMAMTRTFIRAIARFTEDPAVLIGQVNNLLAKENDQLLFVTVCMGFLDLSSGQFRYVTAGHDAPVLIHRDGRVEELPTTPGIALAVTDLAEYETRELQLAPDDLLFLYTDGVSEALNPGSDLFGSARLFDLLGRSSGLEPARLCAAVEKDVRTFEAGLAATDDLTCLAFRFLGAAGVQRVEPALALPHP